MMRRAFIGLLWLLGLGAVYYVYSTDRLIFDRPQRSVDRLARRLSEQLTSDGMIMLVTFGHGTPQEWVQNANVGQSGVEYVPGPTSGARRFDGHQRTFIETAAPWDTIEDSFTLSTWVKLDSTSQNQDILFTSAAGVQVGLKLDQGNMAFFIPATAQHAQVATYRFTRYDEFVHLIAVADAQAGEAHLYENGQLMASTTIDTTFPIYHNVEFGKRRWFGIRHPIKGVLGESAIWGRALDATEVATISRRPSSLLQQIGSTAYSHWRWADAAQRGLNTLLKNIDHFHLGLHQSRLREVDPPELHLFLSNSDLRYFRQAHSLSMQAGRRTRAAAQPRQIHVVNEGVASEANLTLFGANQWYNSQGRKGFILELEDNESWQGMRRVRLVPPEDEDFLRPLLKRRAMESLNLPSLQSGFCLLHINGELQGLYLYEDYTKSGIFPGAGAELFWGPLLIRDWQSRFRLNGFAEFSHVSLSDDIPVTEEQLVELYDDLMTHYEAALINDTRSPLSSRKIDYQLKWARRDILSGWRLAPESFGQAKLAADWLTPFVVLGDNPSPFFIVSDLNLKRLDVPGLGIEWQSSHPDIINTNGLVSRPSGDLPVAVTLTATISDDLETHETSFDVRVMPQYRRLPAKMLWVNDSINKVARVETDVHYFPAGEDAPLILRGSQATNGGLGHRGHTGYWLPRKAFSLRLDEPHFLLDDSPTRHIYLVNAGGDPSGIRNRLSYDIFRSLASPEQPRYAPHVKWAEIFVNGHYYGLMEMTTRVQRRMLGWEGHDPNDEHPGLIFKHENMHAWSTGPRISMRQVFPPRRHGYFFEPYLELLDFVSDAETEKFITELEERMDLENLIDFHLFKNLVENSNGWPFRYWFHEYLIREPGPDERFFFAAWDMDSTFGQRDIWVTSHLFRRLESEYPDFHVRLLERWRELREGPLAEQVLLDRLNEMERKLAGYIEWDLAHWHRDDNLCHTALVEDIRSHIKWRLEHMDQHLRERAEIDPDAS